MTEPPFRFAPLGAEHDRESFRCGEESLDRYFKTQATQDIRRRIAHCFVAVEVQNGSGGRLLHDRRSEPSLRGFSA